VHGGLQFNGPADQPITAPYFAHGKYHCTTANGPCVRTVNIIIDLAIVHNHYSAKTTDLQANHKYTKAKLCISVLTSDHSEFQ